MAWMTHRTLFMGSPLPHLSLASRFPPPHFVPSLFPFFPSLPPSLSSALISTSTIHLLTPTPAYSLISSSHQRQLPDDTHSHSLLLTLLRPLFAVHCGPIPAAPPCASFFPFLPFLLPAPPSPRPFSLNPPYSAFRSTGNYKTHSPPAEQ